MRVTLLLSALVSLTGCSSYRPTPRGILESHETRPIPGEFVAGRCRLTLVYGNHVEVEDLWIGRDSVYATKLIHADRAEGRQQGRQIEFAISRAKLTRIERVGGSFGTMIIIALGIVGLIAVGVSLTQ